MPVDSLGDTAARTSWSLGTRRGRSGGRNSPAPGDVSAALEAACRAAIVDSRPRGESADAAEKELLKRLAGERPVAEEHGRWRLYRWGEGHPVLIGTRTVGAGETAWTRAAQRETLMKEQ